MRYRNWRAICAITDQNLLLFLALTKDEALLRKVASGLPGVLVDEKPEHEGPWPLSVIRRVCATMHNDEPHMEQLTERLGVPVIRAMTARTAEDWEKDYLVMSAAEEQNLPSTWKGLPALQDETLHVFWLGGQKYYIFNVTKKDGYIDLIPAELINENA